ncbi:MAG: hypothetical protein HQ521_20475 [Bacteroidetes bacterium]|nr:hypothetical protein [Bacteroidota bacterium]
MKTIDLKSVIIGILGTVLIFVIMGTTNIGDDFGHIQARSIAIINEDGSPQIYLTASKEGGHFAVADSSGNKCIITQNTIFFINKNEKLFATLVANDDRQHLKFGGQIGKSITVLSSGKDGGSLMTTDSQGASLFSLMSEKPYGGLLKIGNPNDDKYMSYVDGKLLFSANGETNLVISNGQLQTINKRGNRTIILGTNDNDEGSIVVADKDGTAFWGK